MCCYGVFLLFGYELPEMILRFGWFGQSSYVFGLEFYGVLFCISSPNIVLVLGWFFLQTLYWFLNDFKCCCCCF